MRAIAVARRGARSTRRVAAVQRAAVDGRPRARRAASRPASRTSTRDAGTCADRGRRLRLQALDPAPARLRRARRSTVYPHDADADELARYDGVLLSNGPGDPEPLVDEVETMRELLGRVPVFGICLGHQLLALATGHETFKLPFGHRGANHPVLERATGRVLVTSQNHGFAVAPLGRDARRRTSRSTTAPSRASTFPELRARSVQFHPEARPGPARRVAAALERWVEEVALAEAA